MVVAGGERARGDEVVERRLEGLVGAAGEPSVSRVGARRPREDALVDRLRLGRDQLVAQVRETSLLGHRRDVVVVRALVDQCPDREAPDGDGCERDQCG